MAVVIRPQARGEVGCIPLSNPSVTEGVTTDHVIDRLIATTPTKEDELTNDPRFQKIFAS